MITRIVSIAQVCLHDRDDHFETSTSDRNDRDDRGFLDRQQFCSDDWDDPNPSQNVVSIALQDGCNNFTNWTKLITGHGGDKEVWMSL